MKLQRTLVQALHLAATLLQTFKPCNPVLKLLIHLWCWPSPSSQLLFKPLTCLLDLRLLRRRSCIGLSPLHFPSLLSVAFAFRTLDAVAVRLVGNTLLGIPWSVYIL